MSMSITGSIGKPPSEVYEFTDPMPERGSRYIGRLVSSDVWTDGDGTWKNDTYCDYYEEFSGFVNSYRNALWYSPLSKFTGRIDATRPYDTNVTFTLQLLPYQIQMGTMSGTRDVTYATETYSYQLYLWVELDGFGYWSWQGSGSAPPIVLDPFTYNYVESWSYLDFSGMMQSKGMPPVHGTFHVMDSIWIQDGSQERSIYASGTFGPYGINAV